jgi:hypothetical protein
VRFQARLLSRYGRGRVWQRASWSKPEFGGGVKVDAFLLQACGMSSARKSQAHAEKLASCVKNRRIRS